MEGVGYPYTIKQEELAPRVLSIEKEGVLRLMKIEPLIIPHHATYQNIFETFYNELFDYFDEETLLFHSDFIFIVL